MYLIVAELISPALAERLRAALVTAPFRSGQASVGEGNRGLKRNLELTDTSSVPSSLLADLIQAIRANSLLNRWAIPRRSASLIFNRYDAGMYYDDHVDNPVAIIERQFHRSDLSLTLFLSPPDSYDGGELVIESDGPAHAFKLPLGHAIVYETGVLHRVNPVVRGTRLAVVTWIESLVRSSEQRRVLFDLVSARDLLGPDAPEPAKQQLGKAIVNLTRMWSG